MEIRHKTLRHKYSYVYQNSTLIAVIHSTFSIRQSVSNILKENFMTLLQIFNMSNTAAASEKLAQASEKLHKIHLINYKYFLMLFSLVRQNVFFNTD